MGPTVEVKDAHTCGDNAVKHMTYESQLAFKQQQVKNVMTKIAVPELEVRPTLGMEKPGLPETRRKFQCVWYWTVNDRFSRTHDLDSIEDFIFKT